MKASDIEKTVKGCTWCFDAMAPYHCGKAIHREGFCFDHYFSLLKAEAKVRKYKKVNPS